jgi:hypothetical protein
MISEYYTDIDVNGDIAEASEKAIEVLLYNSRNGRNRLPRTAGWGYPEPYTRDIMISALGISVSGNDELVSALQRTLLSLTENQSSLGLIPGLADDATDLGASDTTPLFLMGLAIYRQVVNDPAWLADAAMSAFNWISHQSTSAGVMIGQQPTSDWRDEQWVLGHGLYVNSLIHIALRLFGYNERAASLGVEMNRPVFSDDDAFPKPTSGLLLKNNAGYALWSYKSFNSVRFDLLGNSLAVLSGVASPATVDGIISRIESACIELIEAKQLSCPSPPNLFPFIHPEESEWRDRYTLYNLPGDYHNGGVWPFVCGFHVAALVAAGHHSLARQRLIQLTALCKKTKTTAPAYGFNEWICAPTGQCRGEDWQLWSASMYLYAAKCVETGETPYFVRGNAP